MLGIIRFKKLMICYFLILFVGYLLYSVHHGSGKRYDTIIRNDEDSQRRKDNAPFLGDLNESRESYIYDGDINYDQEELMKKVDSELRGIANANALNKADSGGHEFNQGLSSDEDLEMMIDALHYALPTHALGLEDPWPNASSTATPDYFLRSVAFTNPEYDQSTKSPAETLPLPNSAFDISNANNDSDVIPDYDLDMNGGAYDDGLAYYADDDNFEIPHIIHQTWRTLQVPKEVDGWMTSWSRLHPFWLHWFWTESGFVEMLLGHFPDQYGIYTHYKHDVNRADLRKYFLIYKEGGVVTDLDLEVLRPLDDDLLDKKCILVREPEVHRHLLYNADRLELVTPAFMACRPGHPFFKFLIDSLGKHAVNAKPFEWDDAVLNSTGTMFLSEVLFEYRKFALTPEDEVFVAPAELFMPSFDSSHETGFKVKCNGYKLDNSLTGAQKSACEWLTINHFNITYSPDSYTKHNWLESWKYQYATEQAQFITNIEPDITVFDR